MKMLCLSLLTALVGGLLFAEEPKSERQTVVILLGPPGSGKGTQAVRISKELHIPHISTGDLFRENMSQDTALGQKAKGYINAGQLVPDQLVLDMLFDRVARPDCAKGYLLDGFPRTIPQAEALEKALNGKTRVVVLNLDVPDAVIFKRIEGRLSCPDCGAIYNKYASAPTKENICDKCQGGLIQRSDDQADVVTKRLSVYHEQTEPLIGFYEKRGVLHTVNGEKGSDQVYKELMGFLK